MFHAETRRRLVRRIPAEGLDPCGYGIDVFLFASRHLLVVCTQTSIFRCCILFEAVVCRLYEMLYPCICNVVISCWKSEAYGFVTCRGGTDMCFVLGFGRKRPDLKQYHISGLTPCIALSHLESWRILRRFIQTLGMIRSIIISLPISFLKTTTIPTYQGISIAFPRYIAMQHPPLHDLIFMSYMFLATLAATHLLHTS